MTPVVIIQSEDLHFNYCLEEFSNNNEVQGAISCALCEFQPVSLSSLVSKKWRRELGSSGNIQPWAADWEPWSHTGEDAHLTLPLLPASASSGVAFLTQVLPKMTSHIVSEIDHILANRPYTKKDYRSWARLVTCWRWASIQCESLWFSPPASINRNHICLSRLSQVHLRSRDTKLFSSLSILSKSAININLLPNYAAATPAPVPASSRKSGSVQVRFV